MASDRRPSFLELWLDDLKDDIKRDGARKLVPWWLLAFSCIAAGVAGTLPDRFWQDGPDFASARLALYAALLTLNGLLLALSWNSFSKIYESASAPGFSQYLRDKGMLNTYFFFVDFIHLTQIAALVVSGAGLILGLYAAGEWTPIWLHRMVFAATLATCLYALRYAVGSVTLMQDLVMARIAYEDHVARQGSNVTPIQPRNGR